MPRMVVIHRGFSGSASILRRTRRMCSVTVERPCQRPLEPQTRSSRSSREDPSRCGGQKGQQVELLARHRDFGRADRHRPGALVDDQVAVVEGRRRCRSAPAEDRPHTRLELGERIRLRDEVVGTEVQQADTIALGGVARADDDGDRAAAPDLGQDLGGPAALVQVEDDQISQVAEGGLERGRDTGRLNDVVAEPAQVVLQGPTAVAVVFRHEDRPHRGTARAWRNQDAGVVGTEPLGRRIPVMSRRAG